MGKVKNDGDSKPWFNPPPLESISVSSAELKDNFFLRLCSFLNAFTSISGFTSTCLHVYVMLSNPWFIFRVSSSSFIVRVYFAVFGILIVLQERESSTFFARFSILESWVGRGLFLILCACIMLVLEANQESKFLNTATFIISGCLAFSGCLYFNMGLLCFRELKIRELTQIRRKKQVALQAQQLSAHKSEIEKLLKETESKMQNV